MTVQTMIGAAAAAIALGCIYWGSFIISTGMLLGVMTLGAFTIMYNRIPFLRRIANKFPAALDICAAILTYCLLGNTVTALIASAVVGLGSSFLLDIQLSGQQEKEASRRAAFIGALA